MAELTGNIRYSNVTLKKFADLFGAVVEEFSNHCKKLIADTDFRYQIVAGAEYNQILLDVLKKLDADHLPVSGKERKGDWEKGWSENLDGFIRNNYDLSQLVPKYMQAIGNTKRFNRNYIKPADSNFELNFYTVYRYFFFEKYLADFDSIYEFGCGTGYNLYIMSQLYPEKKLFGLDWATASSDLVNRIGEAYNVNTTGRLFDMFSPDDNLEINDNSVFVTLNSMEQLGGDFGAFLNFILKKSPLLVINSEPLVELYNPNDLLDYLAIKYHRKRGYLNNYLTRLRQLEAEGKLKILETLRIYFGSLFHEGYSLVIWKPLRK